MKDFYTIQSLIAFIVFTLIVLPPGHSLKAQCSAIANINFAANNPNDTDLYWSDGNNDFVIESLELQDYESIDVAPLLMELRIDPNTQYKNKEVELSSGKNLSSANDEWENAKELTCGESVPGSNVGATQSDEAQYPNNRDVWYTYTPETTQQVTFSTCGTAEFDTKLELFNEDLDRIGANNDGAGCDSYTSRINVLLEGGATYYISVGGHKGQTGGFILSLECENLTVLEGGLTCDVAIPLTCGETIIGSTLDAIDPVQSGAPETMGTEPQAPGKWYTITMEERSVVRLSTCNGETNYDSDIEVYEDGPCSAGGTNLSLVASSDFASDFCFNGSVFSADVVFTAEADVTYKVFVNGFVNSYSGPKQGRYELSVYCSTAECEIYGVSGVLAADYGLLTTICTDEIPPLCEEVLVQPEGLSGSCTSIFVVELSGGAFYLTNPDDWTVKINDAETPFEYLLLDWGLLAIQVSYYGRGSTDFEISFEEDCDISVEDIVEVPENCSEKCTWTPGFWRNHPEEICYILDGEISGTGKNRSCDNGETIIFSFCEEDITLDANQISELFAFSASGQGNNNPCNNVNLDDPQSNPIAYIGCQFISFPNGKTLLHHILAAGLNLFTNDQGNIIIGDLVCGDEVSQDDISIEVTDGQGETGSQSSTNQIIFNMTDYIIDVCIQDAETAADLSPYIQVLTAFNECNDFCDRPSDEFAIIIQQPDLNNNTFRFNGDLTLYPNPAQDRLNVGFNLEENSPVNIRLLDMNGKVHLIQKTDAIEGWNLQQVELTNLPAGIYMIHMTNGENVRTKRFVKITE